MEAKNWILRLCAAAIACGILQSVLPFAKAKSAFRVLCGVMLLYVVITPLNGLGIAKLTEAFSFSLPAEQSEALADDADAALLLAANQGYAKALQAKLREVGISAQSVLVICKKRNDAVIPTRIVLRGTFNEMQRQQIEAIRTELGLETAAIEWEAEEPYEKGTGVATSSRMASEAERG